MPKKRRRVMRLYHGSNIVIDSINLAMCRPYKDFKIYIISELRILGYGQRKNVQDL